MKGIYHNASSRWHHDKIHILHRNCSKQYFVTQNDRANVTFPILKRNSHRAYIWAQDTLSISGRNLFPGGRLQLQLNAHVLGDAQKKRASIRQCIYLKRLKIRSLGVIETDFCV